MWTNLNILQLLLVLASTILTGINTQTNASLIVIIFNSLRNLWLQARQTPVFADRIFYGTKIKYLVWSIVQRYGMQRKKESALEFVNVTATKTSINHPLLVKLSWTKEFFPSLGYGVCWSPVWSLVNWVNILVIIVGVMMVKFCCRFGN